MNAGIGEKKTRADHRAIADQLYALYAEGRDLRRLVAIIGESALSEADRRVLDFAKRFEERFVGQGPVDREISETIDLAWELLGPMPAEALKRIPTELIEKYHRRSGQN
jgi:V/A-type H+-transporting ATPase subunit B